jgi:hypothetical protein
MEEFYQKRGDAAVFDDHSSEITCNSARSIRAPFIGELLWS